VLQKKTGRPVTFELTSETRHAVQDWIRQANLSTGDFLFFSRARRDRHLTTRQYARIVDGWVTMIGADPRDYGTHSLRRSKATLIYRQTKNLRAVQLLLGHTKLESTLRCLCVFRAKADTDSTARRTRIPAEGGQRFHAKAAADSTRRRPPSAVTACAPG
jgi:integrase